MLCCLSRRNPSIIPIPPTQTTDAVKGDQEIQDEQSKNGCIEVHSFAKFGKIFILLHALYAIFVPIKNVIVIPFPKLVGDGVTILDASYEGVPADRTLPTFTGQEIVNILNRMLDITYGNDLYFQKLVKAGGFYLDQLLSIVNAEEFATIAQYISLVNQKAEFPSGRFLQRSETVVFKNHTSGQNYTRTSIAL